MHRVVGHGPVTAQDLQWGNYARDISPNQSPQLRSAMAALGATEQQMSANLQRTGEAALRALGEMNAFNERMAEQRQQEAAQNQQFYQKLTSEQMNNARQWQQTIDYVSGTLSDSLNTDPDKVQDLPGYNEINAAVQSNSSGTQDDPPAERARVKPYFPPPAESAAQNTDDASAEVERKAQVDQMNKDVLKDLGWNTAGADSDAPSGNSGSSETAVLKEQMKGIPEDIARDRILKLLLGVELSPVVDIGLGGLATVVPGAADTPLSGELQQRIQRNNERFMLDNIFQGLQDKREQDLKQPKPVTMP